MLDQHDQLYLSPLIHPIPGTVLGRIQEPELTFPVPQHVGLEVGQPAYLADRVKLLDRSGGGSCGHRPCSDLSSRAISSAIPSRAGFPLNKTSQTFWVMGSSTPVCAPRAAPAFEVLAPSATLRCAARYSSNVWP